MAGSWPPEDPAHIVLPRYGGGSLADLLPAVGASMEVGAAYPLALPPARGWVVLLIDGLGWHLLREHRSTAAYLASLAEARSPLTTGLPSTTATSLTSLGTGLEPGRHGVVGYTTRIPGTKRTLNALSWRDGPDPRAWQPHDTALARLQAGGLDVTVVNKRDFAGSGLTVASQRGVPFAGVDDPAERLHQVLAATRLARPVVYAYESALDHTGHERGCRSACWKNRLAAIDAEIALLRSELSDDIGLLVTGDHGMVDVPAGDRVEVDDDPALQADVVVLAGEARFRHVHTRATRVEQVLSRWRDRLAGRAIVCTRDEALESGWFGPLDERVRPRLGDVLVASLGTTAVFSTSRFPVEHKMVGFHGSLTGAETLVPLLVDLPRPG